jgi:hypothetical protein
MSNQSEIYLSYYEYKIEGESFSYDDWDYSDSNVVWGLERCFKDKNNAPWLREVCEVNFIPKIGDTVYIVYIRYETGNVLGRINGTWHILGVYDDQNKAEEVKNSVYNNTYNGYTFWKGLFNSLQSCEVESMIVE